MENVDISTLKANPRNPRFINKFDYDKLVQSIKKFGDLSGIVFNETTGQLVGGHQRIEAFKKLGGQPVITERLEMPNSKGTIATGHVLLDDEKYSYRVVQWGQNFENAANVAANKIQGEFDKDLLAEMIYETSQLENGKDFLDLMGIADDEINKLLDMVSGNAEDSEEDDGPEVDEANPAHSVLCEVYQLGSHRLMCGSATDDDNLDALFDDVQVDMVYTDPPYGMFLDTDFSSMDGLKTNGDSFLGTKGGKVHKQVAGDADDFDPDFIHKVFSTHPDCNEVFLWGADYYAEIIPCRNDGALIVWDKRTNEGATEEQADSADKLFGSNFELCWSKAKHKREIARIRSGIFGVKNEEGNSKTVHPTQKPVQLASWFFSKWGKPGDIVADHFGGSGSTLIACEQTNRICYMMELDPKYVDVIRKRYANLIGQGEAWQDATPAITVDETAT